MDLLSDEQLQSQHPAVFELVKKLEDIQARSPVQGVAELAGAISTYFRTPD